MKFVTIFLSLTLCLTTFSCKKAMEGCNDPQALDYNPDAETSNGSCVYKKEITQSQLDAVTTYVNSVTDTATAHGDSSTIKDIYTSNSQITEGTIMVKKVYQKVGSIRGNLIQIVAMMKQPNGYYSDGINWEYFDIEPDTSVHKNGLIPTNTSKRGKLGVCGSCHNIAPGNDGLFVK